VGRPHVATRQSLHHSLRRHQFQVCYLLLPCLFLLMVRLLPVESFHEELPDYAPDLVVLAGLHMLEREMEPFVTERISQVCSCWNRECVVVDC
jgi:hypothetical protein